MLSLTNKNPAISVIIPIYNVEQYLRQSLDSVIKQTLTNIEIICIDDGSPDNSLEILKEYAKIDQRIIIISRENKGVAVSRNEGIQAAKGEFISFMDSDDWYPSKLNLMELYSVAKKNNALICGGSLSYYADGKSLYRSEFQFDNDGFIDFKDYQCSYFFHRFIYHREMLINSKIFFPQYIHYEDPPFMTNAMITAKRFYAVKSFVYRYRTSYKEIHFSNKRIGDILKGLTDCLILSRENNLSELHTFTVNSLLNDFFPLSKALMSDKGTLHKLLFELFLNIDHNMIGANFFPCIFDSLAKNDIRYLGYLNGKRDSHTVINAYKQFLSDRNIYALIKDAFDLIESKEKIKMTKVII